VDNIGFALHLSFILPTEAICDTPDNHQHSSCGCFAVITSPYHKRSSDRVFFNVFLL
jgi:hypothetical protein